MRLRRSRSIYYQEEQGRRGGGLSPTTMALLGTLAFKVIKTLRTIRQMLRPLSRGSSVWHYRHTKSWRGWRWAFSNCETHSESFARGLYDGRYHEREFGCSFCGEVGVAHEVVILKFVDRGNEV